MRRTLSNTINRPSTIARLVIALALFVTATPILAQEGSAIPDEYRGSQGHLARGHLNGNLIEINYRNYADFGSVFDPPMGIWPRGTNNRHMDGIGMFIIGQVRGHRAKYPEFYGGRPDTIVNPMSMNYVDGRSVSPYGDIWGWLPLPGFHDPVRFNINGDPDPTPAMSDDISSWPPFWPDKLDSQDDPGWRNDEVDNDPKRAAWNGFFGKGVMNADLEAFYVMDDLGDMEYGIDGARGLPFSDYGIFYSDPSDSTKGGLGLQVETRIFQWANVLAEDVMFIVYRVTNVGQTNHGEMVSLPCLAAADASGEPVVTNPCKTGLYFTQFADYGLGWEEFDESSAYDPQRDVAWGWDNDGIGTLPDGGTFDIGITGFAFLESPVYRDDGLDNDEDGMVDESRFSGPGVLIEGQEAIRAYVESTYNMEDFERAYGELESRRAFQAARWWSGDEDLDWVGFNDPNDNGELDPGEVINDDFGRDGLGPYEPGYPGPDEGEADGIPQNPEPNYDETDLEEGDQIGLTGVHLSNSPVYREGNPPQMEDDTWMWERIVENQFPLGTTPERRAADVQPWITWTSGPIDLAPGQTDFFSTAWIFGADEVDFFRNRVVAQDIYNSDYRFAQPPTMPVLSARAGDGYVVLSWDTLSLASYDRFTQDFDFEGYKLYRGTDPLLSDARVITDYRGIPTFYQPIAQWDRRNGITGNRTVLEGNAIYNVGSDTGLEFAYIDRDVTNGETYYYALVAYDRGIVPEPLAEGPEQLPLDPQENTFNVTVDPGGNVRSHSPNVAVVTPRSRAAGYVETSTNESLEAPHGSMLHEEAFGTGSVEVTVINEEDVPEDAVFRLTFHDTTSTGGSTYETSAFTLENRTGQEILLDRQEMAASSPSVAGLVIDFFNDELDFDPAQSGWMGTDGTGAPIYTSDPSEAGLQTSWRPRIEIDPSRNAKVTSSEYRLTWVDPEDSVYTTPRFSSAYPIMDIPVYCTNTTTEAPCDLIVDDTNEDEAFDAGDALIIAEKDCRFCVHGFRFRVTFEEGAGVSPEPGATIAVSQQRPFAEGDFFEFTIRAAHVDGDLARQELEQVAVVPNPYVAAASWDPETQISGRGPRRVQFIHLPEQCTIRIFTMRGELVREIEHRGTGGDGAEWWDLMTRDGQEVAYGVYLYHVEAPGIGTTTGKFAIVK